MNDNYIVVVTGELGIGKTELAKYYFQKYKQFYPGGICWIDGRRQILEGQFAGFIAQLLNSTETLPIFNNLVAVKEAQECWNKWKKDIKNKGKKLVIFDDFPKSETIDQYLPQDTEQFRVLVTTYSSINRDGIKKFPLDTLETEDSIKLLKQRLEQQNSNSERITSEIEAAKKVCQKVNNLPLLIQIIACYLIDDKHITIDKLLSNLNNHNEQKDLLNWDLKSSGHSLEYGKNYFPALNYICFDSQTSLSEEARKLGLLLSLFSFAPISKNLLNELRKKLAWTETRLKSCLAELENNHLLTENEDNFSEPEYEYYELIREFFKAKYEYFSKQQSEMITDMKKNVAGSIIEIAKKIPAKLNKKDVEKYRSDIPHIAELGININDLELVDTENLFYPLIGCLNFYGASVFDNRIDSSQDDLELPVPTGLFKCLIEELCRRKDSQDATIQFFENLFPHYEFQQYLYDTEYLQKLIKNLECLKEKIETLDQHPKAKATLLKLLGHGLYANPRGEQGGECIRYLVKVAEMAEEQRNQETVSEDEKRLWNLFLLAMLDHVSYTLSKNTENVNTNSAKFPNSEMMRKRLDELYFSVGLKLPLEQIPTEEAMPYILRAAHYQGHLGNQSLKKLMKIVKDYCLSKDRMSEQEIEENKINIENEYVNCVKFYYSAANLRVINLYMAFPNKRFRCLERDFPAVIKNDIKFSEWLNNINTNQFNNYERFSNFSQSIGDIGNQYCGLSTANFWYYLYQDKNHIDGKEEVLKEARCLLIKSKDLWKYAKRNIGQDVIIKYYLWTISAKRINKLIKAKLKNNNLPQLNDQLQKTRNEFQYTTEKFGISDHNIQEDSLERISSFYEIWQLN